MCVVNVSLLMLELGEGHQAVCVTFVLVVVVCLSSYCLYPVRARVPVRCLSGARLVSYLCVV